MSWHTLLHFLKKIIKLFCPTSGNVIRTHPASEPGITDLKACLFSSPWHAHKSSGHRRTKMNTASQKKDHLNTEIRLVSLVFLISQKTADRKYNGSLAQVCWVGRPLPIYKPYWMPCVNTTVVPTCVRITLTGCAGRRVLWPRPRPPRGPRSSRLWESVQCISGPRAVSTPSSWIPAGVRVTSPASIQLKGLEKFLVLNST